MFEIIIHSFEKNGSHECLFIGTGPTKETALGRAIDTLTSVKGDVIGYSYSVHKADARGHLRFTGSFNA